VSGLVRETAGGRMILRFGVVMDGDLAGESTRAFDTAWAAQTTDRCELERSWASG